jgi:YVTN family beta-propeller protein
MTDCTEVIQATRYGRAPYPPPLVRGINVALALFCALLWTAPAVAQPNDPRVTPAGFRVDPVGFEIGMSKAERGFQGPLGSALSPDGRYLLSASSGAARFESADVFNLDGGYRAGGQLYDGRRGAAVFYGAAFAPDGKTAWVSGGGQDVVHVLALNGDEVRQTGVVPAGAWPAGLAYGGTPAGARLYVANNLATNPRLLPPPLTGVVNPPGHTVTVLDPSTGRIMNTIDLGTPLEPLGVAFDRFGEKAYVTQWMGRSVAVIDTATETKVADIQLSADPLTADHPSAIATNPVQDEAYTANANSDTVSVIDTTADTVSATIPVGLVPGEPKGATPDGLAVAPDGRRLYVALAGENAVAVIDLETRTVAGFVPTAWYPADVDVSPDGRELVITNTNDSGAGADPCGGLSPKDGTAECAYGEPATHNVASMIKGSVQLVKLPLAAATLARLTRLVQRNNNVAARALPQPPGAREIEHVIYVIKENRTYDQLFGDLPDGNGDASLALFKDDTAPNHRALARRFGLYDNFYADADVSADGHNWATQAAATDYVDKTWPANYSLGQRGQQRAYDFDAVPLALQFPTEPLATDPAISRPAAATTQGYLWDDAYDHAVPFRDYGEYTTAPGDCSEPPDQRVNVSDITRLRREFGTVDTRYPGYNLECADHTTREPEWEREFRAGERDGTLPALSIVRFPNDHTRGTTSGAATPQAYVADNDVALGRMVDVVSHSRAWRTTAILVTEDDAQDGPDHVDAHRTIALLISPWTRAGVDSTHLDTSSMIATIEDILGLPSMSLTDRRVARMWKLFAGTPDLRPYDALTPTVVPFGDPDAPVNGPAAPMADASATWDFTREDATPEIALNAAIWKSVKGPDVRVPRPRHDHIIGSRVIDEVDG